MSSSATTGGSRPSFHRADRPPATTSWTRPVATCCRAASTLTATPCPPVADAARAAAVGGTTTVLSFTNPDQGENALSCLQRRVGAIEEARPAVDIGLHAMAGDPEQLSRGDIAALRQAGASAIKVFLAYRELGIMCTTERLYQLMTWARELGVIVQVHCESGPLIECLHSAGLGAGTDGLRLFYESRPPEVEEEAVARTIAVAALTGATAYLVHLSSAGAVAQVRLARQKSRAGYWRRSACITWCSTKASTAAPTPSGSSSSRPSARLATPRHSGAPSARGPSTPSARITPSSARWLRQSLQGPGRVTATASPAWAPVSR